MITLHGTYDNGKVILDENNLPKTKTKVRVELLDENITKNNIKLGAYNLSGMYDETNLRDFAHKKQNSPYCIQVRNLL